MIQEGIVAALKVTPSIHTLCAGRITPVILPKSPIFPAVTYQDISLVTDPTTDGSGQHTLRIRFNCWADTYPAAKQLQQAIHDLFDGYAGTLPDGTNTCALLDMTQDFYESDSLLFRALSEFNFSF